MLTSSDLFRLIQFVVVLCFYHLNCGYRATIENLFSNEYKVRKELVMTKDALNDITHFERQLASVKLRQQVLLGAQVNVYVQKQ